jgi:hypothetical protein
LLGAIAERLSAFRAVDAIEPDADLLMVLEDGDGVAIGW